jgi:hypothetical protein
MAAPVPAYQNMQNVQSVGDRYYELVTLVMDANTSTYTLQASALRKVKFIEAVVGCPAVPATNGRTAALTGLPLSSTLTILVIGRAGGK